MLRIDVLDAAGARTVSTRRREVRIGARRDVEIPLSDKAAARTHCVLQVLHETVRLVDLGSEHGTRVGGRRVDHAILRPGDEFSIGATRFRLRAYSAGPNGAERTAPPAAPPRRPPSSAAGRAPQTRRPAPAAPVPRAGAETDFGREVRRMLSKAPWYAISLVVHVLALMLLDLVAFETPSGSAAGRLEASLGGVVEQPEAMEIAEPDAEALRPDEAIEESELPAEPDPAEVLPDREPEPPADEREELPTLPEIGSGAGIHGPRRLLNALPRKFEVAGGDAAVDRGNLAGEHADAAETVRRAIGGRGIPRGIPASNILVVKGEFDHIEKILDAYRIAHTTISRDQLLRKKYPSARLLCINCGRRPGPAQRGKLVAVAKGFVQRGGWLITSDWSLDPYLTMGFPDRVERVLPRRRQSDTTIEVHRGPSNSPLTEGVFARGQHSDWWLEETSTFFEVVPGRAEILIVSDEMERRFGTRTVAFEFRLRRGRVLHLMGHFYQKDGNRMGLVSMHRLIINVIRERFPSH